MMQYPVPQFTDVEDKIFGPLTLKQFGIVLLTGGIVFLAYSASKDYVVTAFVGLIVGVPGLALAFGSFNGRAMYNSIPIFINYFTRPKFMVFRKEALDVNDDAKIKTVQVAEKPLSEEDTRTRLKRIQYQLDQRAKEEEELLAK